MSGANLPPLKTRKLGRTNVRVTELGLGTAPLGELFDKVEDDEAAAIWKRANQMLSKAALTPQGILKKFKVLALCTSDDPADDLSAHAKLAKSKLPTRVYPTFRPDRALDVDLPEAFNTWLDRLGAAADLEIRHLGDLLDALRQRHDSGAPLLCAARFMIPFIGLHYAHSRAHRRSSKWSAKTCEMSVHRVFGP